MNTAKNRILSLALAVCLLLTMVLILPGPVIVSADVGIEDGQQPDITVNSTVIGFAGYEWYVVGFDGDGVYSEASDDCMTLLLKTGQGGETPPFGMVLFRDTLGDYNGPYVGNFTTPSDYNDSALHNALLNITFPHKEQSLMVPRTLTNSDGILGVTVEDQLLWPLSYDEKNSINSDNINGNSVLRYSKRWWLRTNSGGNGAYSVSTTGSDPLPQHHITSHNGYIRPAFQLNLESVLFVSDASGTNAKILVSDMDGLVDVQTPGNEIKLTIEDNGLAVDIDNVTVAGNTVDFTYTVTDGSPNRLSAIVRDEDGAVTHYGNLKDNPTSGTAAVALPGGFDLDKDSLEVFVEEVNNSNHTDFASKPQKVGFPEPAELDVDDITFTPVVVDYSQPTAKPITITNISNDTAATITSVTVDDTSKFTIITGSNTTVPVGGSNTDWQVQPNTGLPVDTHTATITVTYDGGENTIGDTANAQVEFVVQATAPPLGTPTLTATPTSLNFGEMKVNDTKTETVKVTGQNLTLPIGYSVSGADAVTFSVSEASGWSDTDGGDLDVTFSPDAEGDYTATLTISNDDTADVTIPLSGKGVSEGGNKPDPDKPDPDKPDPTPGGGTTSRSRSSSGGSSTPDSRVAKTQLPATAFRWDGDRTLTIDHERITTLGLLSVQWDGKTLTRDTDYSVYSGSVVVRFGEDFMAAQSPGDHTVRVEFLNHIGETTVTVGETDLSADLPDNDTHNPNTGGYPDGSYPGATDNPNTGDGRGIRFALLMGSLSTAVLSLYWKFRKHIGQH